LLGVYVQTTWAGFLSVLATFNVFWVTTWYCISKLSDQQSGFYFFSISFSCRKAVVFLDS
jgi:hypothetical protein